jgi:hypothetical protein
MSQIALASINRAPEAKVMMKQKRLVFTKRRMTGGMGASPLDKIVAVRCFVNIRDRQQIRDRAGT